MEGAKRIFDRETCKKKVEILVGRPKSKFQFDVRNGRGANIGIVGEGPRWRVEYITAYDSDYAGASAVVGHIFGSEGFNSAGALLGRILDFEAISAL
jgi:hypothetical protein